MRRSSGLARPGSLWTPEAFQPLATLSEPSTWADSIAMSPGRATDTSDRMMQDYARNSSPAMKGGV